MAEIKKINTELQLESALRDGNGSPGTNGQVLSSTGTATDWISLSEIQGVDGTGTANYISKWSDTDTITNSIIFDNGTNVGIGTTSPTKKLHVNGDAFFQNTVSLPDNAYVGLGSSFDFHLVHNGSNSSITNSTGNLNISSNGGDAVFNTSSSERMRITSAGNVGIGTTSPGNKLHVEGGNIQLSDNQHITWGFGGNNAIYGNNTSDFIKIFTNGAERLIVNSSGNIGIGTTSPSQKLDVAGSINLTGNVFSDQGFYGNRLWNSDNTALRFATNNTERMRISSSGNVGVGTTTPTEKLEVAGNVKLDGDNRHIYFGGNNTFIGERSNSTELELRGGGNSSAQTVYIDNSGRIGVGTSNPTNKLQLVYTDTHTSGDLALANSAFDIYNDSTADVAGKGSTLTFSDNYLGTNKTTRAAIKGGTDTAGNTADGFLAFYTDSGGANSMQQRMIIDNDGNVGIGNTNPTKELEIGTNAAAETEFRMHSDVSGNYFNIQSAGNFTSVKTTGSQNFMLDSGGSSGYITLVTNASERMRVNYNGNVGIGTTSPTQKLHIDGNTLISAQRYYYVAGGGTGFGSDASGNFKIRQNGADLIFGSGNNVGIGTTSPGNKLTISGPSSNQFEIINSANSKSWRPNVNGTSFYITESGVSNPFVIQAGGNVGIGTTSPSEKLEVSGNVKVDKGSAPGRTAYLSDDGLYIGRLSAYGGGYPNNIIADPSNSNNLDINARARISLKLNTNTVLIANDSGNVGIGTTSPSTKFHLVGGIARFDNASSNYLEIDGSDSGTNHARISNRFNQLQLVTNAGASAPHIALLPGTGGNVGIGTSSPDAALEVVGGIKLSDNSPLTWATSNTRIIGQSGYMQFQVGATDKMRITSAGNVGIGTTSPSKKLQVNGQTQFYEHSGANLTHQSTSNFSFDTLANNTASSTGGSVGAYIKLTATPPGATGVWSTFRARAYGENAKGNTDGMITFFSEYRNYTSTNAVTLGYHAGLYVNPLGVGGLATVTNNYGVYLNPGTSATNNYGVYQNGSSVKNFFQGNVGIGTTSPGAKLDVNGTTYLRSVALDSIFGYSGNNIQFTNSGNTTFNNSNVGIGTTSPSEKLHVFGGAAAIKIDSTTNEASLKYDNSTTTANIKLANNDLKTELGGTEVMRILANGNVGIGTTSPNAKLNVNGNVKIEGTNPLYFGGSGSVPNWEIKAYGSGGNDLLINDTGTNSGDLIFTGQDFGVGTTNPSEKLHVSGEPHPSIRLSSSSDSNYNVVINCGYRDEALNLSVGGYKVFTTEGYNTPETTHLYSNNSKALSLASNQAATFTSTVTATNFINSSDERLKENIEKVCNNSLDVQWKTFEFKSDRGQKRYGVIAQELEKTNPEFVREDAEGFKSVAYIDLLIAKIAELEERIQTLENK